MHCRHPCKAAIFWNESLVGRRLNEYPAIKPEVTPDDSRQVYFSQETLQECSPRIKVTKTSVYW